MTHLLITNPLLLALSPAILVIMLVGSIPFVTLIFRLLLVSYSTKIGQSRFERHGRIGLWLVLSVELGCGKRDFEDDLCWCYRGMVFCRVRFFISQC